MQKTSIATRLEMNEVEVQVQKNLINFCTYLCKHVEEWKSTLQESNKSIATIQNQCEQLLHVEKANLKDMDGFEQTQKNLQFSIIDGIEEEFVAIRLIIEKLNKANQNLKNKLATLEKSSLDLNWNRTSPLIMGSPIQPPLARLLTEGLDYWLYFKKAFDNINGSFKVINVRSNKSVKALQKALEINLNVKVITDYIAITQYIDNVKMIS